jgi:ATP-independent RNA helicase DbpA
MNPILTPQSNETAFNTLPLLKALLTNLESLNYLKMTPVQAESLPIILQGHDLITQAKTGSGKTVAFGLSILNQLNLDYYGVQALVLCPTRELADQVSQVMRQLARLMPNVKVLNLSGGMPMKAQLDSLRHGAHVIVGTPGRIQKHLTKQTLKINKLKILVLDEADRMLDMGFLPDMKEIIALCPKPRQTLLFSATYPDEIKKISQQFMKNALSIAVKNLVTEQPIEQLFYEVKTASDKFKLLKNLLKHYSPSAVLIFCNTKKQTVDVTENLKKDGLHAMALNGDMEQPERDLAIIRFTNLSCPILVATDVAARGIDIKELPAIINYELAFENDVHIHRIGRTGRGGNKGLALSITTPADAERLIAIETNLGRTVTWGSVAQLKPTGSTKSPVAMTTIGLNLGRKDKIRPGDILGSLIKEAGLPMSAIGKIDITPTQSYVAIQPEFCNKALKHFQEKKLKNYKVHVKKL